MSIEPYLSEIGIFPFGFPPRHWALCNGQLLPINQNQALFSLLGTNYGGNGQTTFGLPDLRGRVPIHKGNGHILGEKSGEDSHTISLQEMPLHTHIVQGSSNVPNTGTPAGNFWTGNTGFAPYSGTTDEQMSPTTISSIGGNQAHENRSPFLTLNFCIALTGIFPSQN